MQEKEREKERERKREREREKERKKEKQRGVNHARIGTIVTQDKLVAILLSCGVVVCFKPFIMNHASAKIPDHFYKMLKSFLKQTCTK